MTGLLIWLITGGLAGLAHVFTGPDHLAAVAPLAIDQRRRTWLLGLLWGIGHSSGVCILALLALGLRSLLPIEGLSAWSEWFVGVVLIVIGLYGLRKLITTRVHAHEHQHDGEQHVHIHAHSEPIADNHPHDHSHSHSALGIGALHGFAGTSHLLGVLPALALPNASLAAAYVIGFGLGSIAAMCAFSWAMGLVVRRCESRSPFVYQWLAATSSLAAITIGIFWLYQST